MRYFSTFSGIGGFELGIINAIHNLRPIQQDSPVRTGEHDYAKDKSLEWECVGYSEIDKYAIQIYQKHFPDHKQYGDITKINAEELPDFDLLVGGFPCQAFSIAGKRRGFEDTRGTLFFELARILRAKQPRLFVFENVKGLLSHSDGQTFRTIIATLDELGYDLQWQVLNSKNHGVPQNRERIFIIGHLRGTPRPKVFPFGESNPRDLEQIIGGGQGNRVYGSGGVSVTLASQAGGRGAKTGLYTPAIRATCYKKGDNDTLVAKTVRTGGRSSPHGSKQNWDSYEINGTIRRLTPTECERLQGFPDGWTEGISDSQRYKCLGNAVTTNVIADIIERLITT
jgi:DNA (cytosine-5)-methyltransferase 1